jgi:uncharacterized membrane protein/nitrite reductase/ring-hydroxylating ferredoxin subunit
MERIFSKLLLPKNLATEEIYNMMYQLIVVVEVRFLIVYSKLTRMKSKAHLASHPLHPILVSFPIAFFTGAFVFDLFGVISNRPALSLVAYYLDIAGIIGALAAAVPGAIDYFMTIPPESSAKKRGTQHAIINLVNLGIFTYVWFYRRDASANPYLILGLEAIGVILLSIAGWMGGTLVHRNQIGIDHRYANAAKWNQEYINTEDKKIKVARVGEIKINAMKLMHINGKRIVIGNTEKGHVAFSDHCSHKGASLADGSMICGTVQCPWHGSQFDTNSGEVKAGPAKEKIDTYTLQEANGNIYLLL